jgi:bifunctional non-homologous end joining protein LigD
VAFTNLDKVFFPELGLTKGDVIAYYRRIAPYVLPHLRDRPLTLRRWPNGITGDDFFQKDVEDPPAFVQTVRVWSSEGNRDLRLVICNDEATLLWLAQLGCIEMHAWFSRIAPIPGRGKDRPGTTFAGSEGAIARSTLNHPDVVVFDIDPFLFPEGEGPTKLHGEYDPDYTRRGFEAARKAALTLGKALDDVGLRAFVKTSGKTGLHIFIPIVRQYTYEQTHAFAKTMATWLAGQLPETLTTAWSVRDRVGKVFLDYNQNLRGKTLASVYSLRPVPQATVSVPVTWEELRSGFDPLQWTVTTVFDRLERVGDLWADILGAAQRIAFPRPRV